MGRRGIEPYSDEAEREGSRTEMAGDYVSAIPKEEFDGMFERCREANARPRARSARECAFEIPSGRDEVQWFRVDLEKCGKGEKPGKAGRKLKTKSKGKKRSSTAQKGKAVDEKPVRRRSRRGIIERYFCF